MIWRMMDTILNQLAGYSCLQLLIAAHITGILLLVLYYVIATFELSNEFINIFAVCGISVFFSALPFHYFVTGACETWRAKRRAGK